MPSTHRMKMSSMLRFIAFFFVAALLAPPARAADTQPPDHETLVRELAEVQASISSALAAMTTNNAALLEQRHAIEYNDPDLIALRDEMIALEKQLVEKRKQVEARLSLRPELKALEAQRKAMFQNVQELRDREAAIKRELAAAENAEALKD